MQRHAPPTGGAWRFVADGSDSTSSELAFPAVRSRMPMKPKATDANAFPTFGVNKPRCGGLGLFPHLLHPRRAANGKET